MKFIFLFIFVIINLVNGKKSYNNFKVYNVVPKSDQIGFIENLKTEHGIEFWEDQIIVNHELKIMVAPDKQNEFETKANEANITISLAIDNVQRLIDEQLKPNKRQGRSDNAYSFEQYHTLEEIYSWLDDLASTYSSVVTSVVIGQTYEGREIKGVILNFKEDGSDLKAMIEGGIHAREWISPSTVTWIIHEFLTSTDPEIRELAENFEWHIFPVVNPDGYSYTFTNNRMWRKNRNPANFTSCEASGAEDEMSYGIDLNRNFDFAWMTIGASDDPCSNLFAGTAANSEPEARAISNYILTLKEQGDLIFYLAFHSYTQLLLVPYSHVSSDNALQSGNYGDMFEVAVRGSERSAQRYGTTYRVGLSANLMYEMSGTSFDWVKYEAQVPFSYLFELRDLGNFGFLLPPEQIIPTGLEIMDALVEMYETGKQLGYYSNASSITASMLLSFILSVVFIL